MLNQDWEPRLTTFYTKYSENERTTLMGIINQFDCNEIYNPSISEHEIFDHIYNKQGSHEGEITAKRQPNPFMIFRTTLGLTAARKHVKLGDGTAHSRIAGLLWRGAMQSEKKNFDNLSVKFKDIHKQRFPGYEYKPKQRSPVAGTFVENMTKNNFESDFIKPNNQSMPQQLQIPQQIQQDNIVTWSPSYEYYPGVDPNFMIDGSQYPYQQEPLFCQVPQFPTEYLVSLTAESFPTNPLNNELNTLNKPDNFNLNYSSQETQTLNKPDNFGFNYLPQAAENNQYQYDINHGYNGYYIFS